MPVLSSNVIFHYNTFQIERNEGLFLDVNQKRPSLDINKIKFHRTQNLRNILKKKNLGDLIL